MHHDDLHPIHRLFNALVGALLGVPFGALLLWVLALFAEPPGLVVLGSGALLGALLGYRFGDQAIRTLLRLVHHPNL